MEIYTILSSKTFEEIYVQKGINETHKQVIKTFFHYFNKVFPLKSTINRGVKSNTYTSKGIKVFPKNEVFKQFKTKDSFLN
jgi:hypothetical protein